MYVGPGTRWQLFAHLAPLSSCAVSSVPSSRCVRPWVNRESCRPFPLVEAEELPGEVEDLPLRLDDPGATHLVVFAQDLDDLLLVGSELFQEIRIDGILRGVVQ